jgi:hypothetical protein
MDDGEAEAVTFGKGFTVIVTRAVFVQPVEVTVPVTVYVVVVDGVAIGFAILALFKDPEGDH